MAINGTNGADKIVGTKSHDEIKGLDGDDTIQGDNGNDILDGGRGNDKLEGGFGNNVYRFGKGDGNDFIVGFYDNRTYTGDEFGKLNTLEFKPGVAVADVTASRSGSNLILKIGSADSVTVQSFFSSDNPNGSNNPIQEARFADGSTWTRTDLITQALKGGPGDDTLVGTDYGDTLDGGRGNDKLEGGFGNNVYRFGKGDGNDFIVGFYDSRAYTGDQFGKLNTLEFKPGVAVADVTASRSGSNLILKIGSADSVTVQSFFSSDNPNGSNNPIQEARFADGSTWTRTDLVTQALKGGPGDDTLVGTDYGDTLDGGRGNDKLEGGFGNNVYLFGRGDGNDLIASFYDSRTYTGDQFGKLNTLRFDEGVLPGDLHVQKAGSNLVVKLAGEDSITIGSFLSSSSGASSNNPIQHFEFASGEVWSLATIIGQLPAAKAGTAGADELNGTAGNDALNGLAGHDKLTGGAGNDQIDGGSGIDTAVYLLSRASYAIAKNPTGFTVGARDGVEGMDLLTNVERIQFSDGQVAFDLSGNAGKVAKILGAVFGADSVGNKAYVGIGLSYLDAGMNYEDLCGLAMSVTGRTSIAQVVDLLWENVWAHSNPPQSKAALMAQLEAGLSVGALTMMAAETDFNAASIDLVGLAANGLGFN